MRPSAFTPRLKGSVPPPGTVICRPCPCMVAPLTARAVISAAIVNLTGATSARHSITRGGRCYTGRSHVDTDTSADPPQAVPTARLGRLRARTNQQEQADHRLRGRAHLEQAEREPRGPLPP